MTTPESSENRETVGSATAESVAANLQELRQKAEGKAFPFNHKTCMALLDEIEQLRDELFQREDAEIRALSEEDDHAVE